MVSQQAIDNQVCNAMLFWSLAWCYYGTALFLLVLSSPFIMFHTASYCSTILVAYTLVICPSMFSWSCASFALSPLGRTYDCLQSQVVFTELSLYLIIMHCSGKYPIPTWLDSVMQGSCSIWYTALQRSSLVPSPLESCSLNCYALKYMELWSSRFFQIWHAINFLVHPSILWWFWHWDVIVSCLE